MLNIMESKIRDNIGLAQNMNANFPLSLTFHYRDLLVGRVVCAEALSPGMHRCVLNDGCGKLSRYPRKVFSANPSSEALYKMR